MRKFTGSRRSSNGDAELVPVCAPAAAVTSVSMCNGGSGGGSG